MTEYCRDESGFFNGCGQFAQCVLNVTAQSSQTEYYCEHDEAFDMSPGLWVSYILMPLFIGIGMLGGLGGGILKGPFLEVILNYSQSTATHIAYCLMFGGTCINTILLMFERKPDEQDRPIINFWIAVVFNLGIPLATNLGSSLVVLLPQLWVLILSEIFLISVAPILWNKGMQQKEREKQQKLLEKSKTSHKSRSKLSHNRSKVEAQEMMDQKTLEANLQDQIMEPESSPTQDREYMKWELDSQNLFPGLPISLILGSFAINQVIILMLPTSNYHSYIGISTCSLGDYLILALLIMINVVWSTFVYFIGSRRELAQNLVEFKPDERYFTPLSTFAKVYAGGLAAGFISGFLGMGAGLVMVPVLLSCGLIARCSSATSALNYFMISLNNLITLLINHYLDWQMIVLFTFLAMIGGSVFTKIGYILMNKYKVGYIVIFFVLFLDILNVFSEVYYGVVTGERYQSGILTTADKQC